MKAVLALSPRYVIPFARTPMDFTGASQDDNEVENRSGATARQFQLCTRFRPSCCRCHRQSDAYDHSPLVMHIWT